MYFIRLKNSKQMEADRTTEEQQHQRIHANMF